jgi:hypothetical protein
MTGKTSITIKGQEYNLYFGKSAIPVLWKGLFDNQFSNPDMHELLEAMNKLVNENYYSFMKLMLYAGICGYELEFTGVFKPSITPEKVGELLSGMTEKEEAELLASPWKAFWDSFGASLEKINELESEPSEGEKKK